jgi:hypothetical protein
MTPDERIQHTEATLDRLAIVVAPLSDTVVAHDKQIGALLALAEKQGQEIADQGRQLQAYINTLPRQ